MEASDMRYPCIAVPKVKQSSQVTSALCKSTFIRAMNNYESQPAITNIYFEIKYFKF